MKILNFNKKVIAKSWCENIEESALEQLENLCSLPFVFKYIAIMPDCHAGYGVPIGSVLATKDVVIPNAVGVDISCGICATKTNIKLSGLSTETLKKIMDIVREKIPVGMNRHKEKQAENLMPNLPYGNDHAIHKIACPIIANEYNNALQSLGSLGSGNHFIEFQKDKEDCLWIMIHSGSRNLGKKVADHYNKIAIELNKKWYSSVPIEFNLAFLPLHSFEGRCYITEMDYCEQFAYANRAVMMNRIIKLLYEILQPFAVDPMINIAHNYARLENHFGVNVMVHRKGATSAKKGEIGIIPGSMGTKSYIVKGLGNKESFESCSHGAGRKMSRTKAKADLNLIQEQKTLNDQGIIHGIRTVDNLDEAPSAYKSIEEVMNSQSDLVEILHELIPVAVLKG